ncbi:amino acid ABC transporter permease [Dermatophilaceae bacterium Sec6.4]
MSKANVLFDEPGPQGRRRIVVATVGVLAVAAAVVAAAVWQFGRSGQLAAGQWSPFTQGYIVNVIWQGMEGTLRATVVAVLISFPLGALVGLMRVSVFTPVRVVARIYVEFFRSIPLLLLIYFFLLVLPFWSVNLPIFWKLVAPIILTNVAILAEVFRAGIGALDRGQFEAAEAVGMRRTQMMRLVVLPQVIRLLVPALVNGLITVLKDTTLGYVVSYPELMRTAQNITASLHLLIQTYLIAALIYVVVNALLSQLAHYLERRLSHSRRSGRSAGAVGNAEEKIAVAMR